jgi:hypothetical protein
MKLTIAYLGRSTVGTNPAGLAVALAPNLRRDRVSFDGLLRDPIRFRESAGALHDVVVGDLRFKHRDRSAYDEYRAQQERREGELRRVVGKQARAVIEMSLPELPEPFPPGFEARHRRLRGVYWSARQRYSSYLMAHDPELWRLLVPCDPVVTVAADCLFFECFSADESSYGCMSIDRSAFGDERNVAQGTTNVDYSSSL